MKVDVLIPCFNESVYIKQFMEDLVRQDYGVENLNIYLIDGGSNDGTRAVVAEYAERFPSIRLLENPKRIQHAAMNLGIVATSAPVVLRLDVHTHYPLDYISRLCAMLHETGADNVGGVRHTHTDDSLWSRAVAALVSNVFSSGGAPWRSGARERVEVDTVFCGCFTRDTLNRVGQFNENLRRGEDKEYNLRIKAIGGRIILDPEIVCQYYPRTHLGGLIRWNCVGAFYVFVSPVYTEYRLYGLKNFAPLGLVAYLMALLLGSVTGAGGGWLWSPLICYFALAVFFACGEARTHRDLRLIPVLPPLFFAMHCSYGVGGVWGLLARLWRR